MPVIQILKTGTFHDANGRTVPVTAADIRGIASRYAAGSAHLIRGHDTATKAASHGEVKECFASRDGNALFAWIPRVSKAMRSWNKDKQFRRVSAGLRRLKDGLSLHHVGMLGARSPAIKDLPAVVFAGAEEAPEDLLLAEMELPADDAAALATAESDAGGRLAGLVDRLDRLISGESRLAAPAPEPAGTTSATAGQEGDDVPKTLEEQQAELDERERDLRQREAALAASQTETARQSAHEFCEELAEDGRILPADVAPLEGLLAELDLGADGEGLEVELAAPRPGARPARKPAHEFLRDLLSRVGPQVDYQERSAEAETDALHHPFAAPARVDMARSAQEDEVMKLAEKIVVDERVEFARAAIMAEARLEAAAKRRATA